MTRKVRINARMVNRNCFVRVVVGVTKNNNKIVSEEDNYTKEALMQELQEMGEERKKLVLQLGEKNGQLNTLKNEIAKLKVSY